MDNDVFLSRVHVVLIMCGWLAASAPADAGERAWNPHYAPPASRAAAGDQEAVALRQVNLRRAQIGLPVAAYSAQIAQAARAHSSYLAINNLTGHYEDAAQYPQGFTGVSPGDRLTAAGYAWRSYDEVISSGPATGVLGVESLVEAIYHRFGLFSPGVDEAGTGFAEGHPTYGSVLTVDLGTRQSIGLGDPGGWVGVYPTDGQTGVPLDFHSDEESPDPVPNANRVGYPVSLHAGNRLNLSVSSFTLATADGGNVPVQLLSPAADSHVPSSAAAIVPTQALTASTTYVASFSGSADGQAIARTWRFTTAPPSSLGFLPANPCLVVGSSRDIFVTGGGATNVRWSDGRVVGVSFVSAEVLRVTALAVGTATLTVVDSDNGQADTTVTVATTCTSGASTSDRLFDWAESNYRHLFEPPGQMSQSAAGYYFRHYPVTNTYLGTKDGFVWYYDAFSGALLNVGAIDAFLPQVSADGF